MSRPFYIVWNDNYNLGIPIVDEQHRGMVALINSFHYALQEGYEFEKLKPFKALLEGYVEVHFETEEALMKKTEYPEFVEHHQLHKDLTNRINEIARQASKSGDPDVALKFLKDWWVDHINGADKKFGFYVKRTA